MNERYLNLMEKALSAYSDEHILRYFNDVKENGLTEHGFPRLTVNIGMLISYGKRRDLLPIFLEMMEFCCKTIPNVKAANDFSVREIISCIWEIEKNNAVSKEDIERWKGYLTKIEPETCYNKYAQTPTDSVKNWALFTGVSEFFRLKAGLCKNPEETLAFVELQIEQQLQWLDENGMYKDGDGEFFQPIVYDLVPRVLFSALLHVGYRGKYYEAIDSILRKAGLLTLKMQSVTGELAFGGRSNQFLHNESTLAAVLAYEATRYQKEGDYALAGKFKAALEQALKIAERWLSKTPITHVKNRFPIDSKFGCEGYAYFDKYMITFASNLYMANMFGDESIMPSAFDCSPMVWSASKHFHKTFARAGGYSVEFDTNADTHYDASGLGRVHKKDAPSVICLSVPCPENESKYNHGDYVNKTPFSICPAIKGENGEWLVGASADCVWTLTKSEANEEEARVELVCDFGEKGKATFACNVSENGVLVEAKGNANEQIGICLPAFFFDGEAYAKITENDGKLCVSYDGWVCEYQAENIENLQTEFANRNGVYKGYITSGMQKVQVKIKIYKLGE